MIDWVTVNLKISIIIMNICLSFLIPLIVQTDMGTALHEAALYGKLDVVKVLLERGTV